MSGGPAAVDVQSLAGDEPRLLEVEDSVNDGVGVLRPWDPSGSPRARRRGDYATLTAHESRETMTGIATTTEAFTGAEIEVGGRAT
jgi:hypothetical protein